jgi:NADP-dependent 3-hydroxy acid dehydrogenase YdfG
MADVIFITGATSGFGEATARLFAENGWNVVATGRRTDRLTALAGDFAAGRVLPVEMDLMDVESIKAAIAGLPASHKPIKCLFNNGGLALGTEAVPDIDLEDWRVMVETNIMGLVHTTQFALPLLKAAGRGASIINVGSIAGRYPYPGGNVYGASKAFVRQFSYELRTDLAGTDIRVTSLEPGMGKSEFTLVRTKGDEQANRTLYEGVEPILPEDVADAVWWLANRPPHINVNSIEIMPLAQVPARPLILKR